MTVGTMLGGMRGVVIVIVTRAEGLWVMMLLSSGDALVGTGL